MKKKKFGLCVRCGKYGMYKIKSQPRPKYTILKCRYCGVEETYS